MADFFLCQHIWATGQTALLSAANTNGCPNVADYPSFEVSFRDFLSARQAEWAAAGPGKIAYLREERESIDPAALRGLSVLVVMPQFINSSDRFIENDFIDHYQQSLIAAGVKAECFFSNCSSYVAIMGLDRQAALAELAELRHVVESSRPDILLFDANFIGQNGSLSAGFVAELQHDFGVKLVAVISDGWGDYGRAIADYWAPVSDVVVHIAPGGEADKHTQYHDRLLCTACPVNPRHFYAQPERSLDLSFFGSYGTYLRAFWLTRATKVAERLSLRSNLRGHNRTSDCPTMAEYAAIMRQSRMVLNFSARSPGVKIMTGRVWQATNVGAVLLEEANEPVKQFFVPFVHYVPFENARQLGHMIAFFHRNPDWAARIGQAAADFCQRHYSSQQIWSQIFGRLYRDRSARASSTQG